MGNRTLYPLFLVSSLVFAQGDPRAKYFDLSILLSPEQKQGVLKRIMEKEPFLKSFEAQRAQVSMGKYFQKADYQKLAGNPGLGYYWAPLAFTWPAGVHDVEFTPPVGLTKESLRIAPTAWVRAMELVARKNQLTVVPKGKGRIRIQGAVVRFLLNQRYPEVTLELKVTDARGNTLLYRKTEARPTAGDAVGALLDFMISFARKFGERGPHAA